MKPLNLVLVVSAAAVLCACGRNTTLSEPPARAVVPYKGTHTTSTAQIDLKLPLSDLTTVVQKAIPENYSQNGSTKFRFAWKNHRVDYSYKVTRGSLTVTPASANAIRITIPLSLRGSGNNGGFIGNIVGSKTFDANTTVLVDLGLSINAGGCPEVAMTTNYSWTSHPRVEIAGGVWVNVDDAGNAAITKALEAAKAQAQQAVNCDKFNKLLTDNWKHYSFPLKVPEQEALTVDVTPVKLGTTGTVVEGSDLRVTILAEALTSVTTAPLPPTPVPKPVVAAMAPTPGSLKVVLPVYVGYDRIEATLKQYTKDKTFTFEVQGKPATVQVLDAKVYPAKDALAVGLEFNAKLPGKIFDTKGWVYLLGKPTISPDGKTLSLTKVDFTRKLDNEFWSVVTSAFQDQIRAEITKASTVDLSAKLAEAAKALTDEVNFKGTGPGYKVLVSQPTLSLNQIVVTDSLLIEPQLNAKLDITADLLALAMK